MKLTPAKILWLKALQNVFDQRSKKQKDLVSVSIEEVHETYVNLPETSGKKIYGGPGILIQRGYLEVVSKEYQDDQCILYVCPTRKGRDMVEEFDCKGKV